MLKEKNYIITNLMTIGLVVGVIIGCLISKCLL